ncbi:MAG: esterase family protein [Planctomycetaceae bacterium]|jgi:pimeloyl-ACP methyl ester carboxylesterase|nr:esterase family protein [Planctomycetaceae bacterium]
MRFFINFVLLFLFLLFSFTVLPVFAAKIVLKDGRTLEGKHTELTRVDEKAEEVGKIRAKLIVVVEDGLRYIFVPKYNISHLPEETTEILETFRTRLRYSQEGLKLHVLGEFDNSTRFDFFGRRLLQVRHYGGVELFSQAITELTPRYIRARGIHINNQPLVWDMRIATNALPREQLTPILLNQIDTKNLEDRIRLVRFYIQGKLFENAVEELYGILDDWKNDPEVKQRLSSVFRMIRQQQYQRRLDELELHWKSGQYLFVRQALQTLEKDENLPEQLFMSLRRMLQRYDDFEKKREETITVLKSLYEKLPDDEKNSKIPPILDEIAAELSFNTIDRLAAFHLYIQNKELSDSEKLAVGITGWFAGSNADNRRLAVAATLPETRQLVLEYLQSENNDLQRKTILEQLKTLESARPDLIARILAHIKPPKEDLPLGNEEHLGFYSFEIDNPIRETVEKIRYVVQLPPEYDLNRRYPVIVALNGNTQSPEMMLDWWAGSWRGKERYGHATRNGFIVVAPDWNPPEMKQLDYDFSALAHASVLYSLKDVLRRFNIDTDRVFLTGHGIGGTAAWDIGLAHPDLWAGVIPFNAVASKYINAYRDNVRYVPLYFVWGELEGIGNQPKWVINAPFLNRNLAVQHRVPDITVVRYIGRGVEGFSDEILNLFEWMKLRQRNFTPMEFESNTMRAWDSFFWWVEMNHLDKDKPDYVTDPLYWQEKEPPKNIITVRSKLLKASNSVQIDIAPKISNVQVFLTPEMIDFNNKTTIRVGSKNFQPQNGFVEPDISVILEDARTRSDRLHPFWAVLNGQR